MKIVLREDVEQLGKKGDLLDVAAGYARNYLVPRGLAIVATQGCGEAGRGDAAQPRGPRRARARSRPRSSRRGSPRRRSRSRRVPARAASSSARSPTADIAAAIAGRDRRRDRSAQDHARRAAQGARSGRGRRCTLHAEVTVTRRGRGRRRAERFRVRSDRARLGPPCSRRADSRAVRPPVVTHAPVSHWRRMRCPQPWG